MQGVKFGSWGGKGGINPWKFTPEDGWTFTKITIVSIDDCVYSIGFTYTDKDNLEHDSPTYGGKTSFGTTEILNIDDEEYVTGISGTVWKYVTPSFQRHVSGRVKWCYVIAQ
ncbi:GOS9-like protein [Tanacetum coccineum]